MRAVMRARGKGGGGAKLIDPAANAGQGIRLLACLRNGILSGISLGECAAAPSGLG